MIWPWQWRRRALDCELLSANLLGENAALREKAQQDVLTMDKVQKENIRLTLQVRRMSEK